MAFIQCKKCTGTGFILRDKNEQICLTCIFPKRCYLCENVKVIGKYKTCNNCYGDGKYLVKKD